MTRPDPHQADTERLDRNGGHEARPKQAAATADPDLEPRARDERSASSPLRATLNHVGRDRDAGAGVLDALAELEAWDERDEDTDHGHLLSALVRSPRPPKARVPSITEIEIAALQPVEISQAELEPEVEIQEDDTTRIPTGVMVSEASSAASRGRTASALDYALGTSLDDEPLPTAEVVPPSGSWVAEHPESQRECLTWPEGARPPEPTILDGAPRRTEGATAEVAWSGERPVDVALDEPTVPHHYTAEDGEALDGRQGRGADPDEDTLIKSPCPTGSHSALARCERKTRMGELLSA